MYVRRIVLSNFRCYRTLDLALPDGPVVIAGDNAQGKSSLLEALYVLATTRSPYAQSDRELIHWAATEDIMPFSRVSGEVVRAEGHEFIEIVNVRQSTEPGVDRFVKQVRVNGAARRALDVVGRVNVVLFAPRDLDIVHGAPSERRRYLDILLCQIDPGYCRALARYNRVLAQRNHLLRQLRDRGGDRAELTFWNDRLVADGASVLARRLAATDALSNLASGIHDSLAGQAPPLAIEYQARLTRGGALGTAAADTARLPREPAPLAAVFMDALTARRDEEITRGMTLVGPHRDDMAFRLDAVDMRTYGSRGQQRTVTLALKLAEAELMHQTTGERPVLLLDDVLSELDARRQSFLLDHIQPHQQTLVTTTDATAPALARLGQALVLRVVAATVSVETRVGPSAPDFG